MNRRFLSALTAMALSALLVIFTAGLGSVASATSSKSASGDTDSKKPLELDWEALIPEGWNPDALMDEYDVENMSDDDPRVDELMEKMREMFSQAPVVESLNGKRVRLPGFIVPLDMDAKTISNFLLVPYYGACIHVPPPPANQTIHVETVGGAEYKGELFDAVWVTGTLSVKSMSSDLADAGYRIDADSVTLYEEPIEVVQ